MRLTDQQTAWLFESTPNKSDEYWDVDFLIHRGTKSRSGQVISSLRSSRLKVLRIYYDDVEGKKSEASQCWLAEWEFGARSASEI
jgi:hypothetical protein